MNTGIKLIPSFYNPSDRNTDFGVMIELPMFRKSMFVFNDDEGAFRFRHRQKGRGNAVIRPYPNAFGIPTGVRHGRQNIGYSTLDHSAKIYIDESLSIIENELLTYKYKYVVYSANKDGSLGTGYFTVGNNVKEYIVDRLKSIIDNANKVLGIGIYTR